MDVKGLAAAVALYVCGGGWVCPVRRGRAADGFAHAHDKMISKGPYTRLLEGLESVLVSSPSVSGCVHGSDEVLWFIITHLSADKPQMCRNVTFPVPTVCSGV